MTTAMVLAAGLGTRLRPFTDRLPKALVPVMGIPVAQYGVDSLAEAGVSRLVVNAHHLPAELRAGFAGLDLGGAALEWSDESRELLGSAGGIRHALPLLGRDPFLVTNADRLLRVDFARLLGAHRPGDLLTLAVHSGRGMTTPYRELGIDGDRVRSVGEIVAGKPFYLGAAVMAPEAFASLADGRAWDFARDVLAPAVRADRVGAVACDEPWLDIDSPGLLRDAHFLLMEWLETRDLPGAWARRIESLNTPRAPSAWLARESDSPSVRLRGRAYYRGSVGRPVEIGPDAVVYGEPPPEPRGGIGIDGAWITL